VDVATAARQWKHVNVEAERIGRYLPPESWLSLRYEALCADPAAVLDRIADFLGVSRVRMEGFQSSPRHIIGNKMRMKGVSEIREDLSWQTTLTPKDLATIARVAGRASRGFGYAWP
jgi:hypothetical protein